MLKYTAGLKYFLYLALDGKYPINDTETDHDWDLGGLTVISTLPVEVRPEFKAIPPAWRVVQVGAHFGGPGMLFRQYRDGNFILGSINTQSLWQQQRSVVAYWPSPTPNGPVQFFQDMSALTMGNGYARFASDQSKAAVLAVITGKTPQPAKGGLELGFNLEAKAKPLEGGPPGAYEVDNGGVTTYFYPVTNNGGAFSTRSDTDVTYIERPWSSADVIANYGLLAYLVVFQPPGDAVPTVSNVSLTVAGKVGTAAATVNGAPLSVQVSE